MSHGERVGRSGCQNRGGSTCLTATCAHLDLPDVDVLAVARGRFLFTVVVETVPPAVACPSCGVLAVGHGRRQVLLYDLPRDGVPVRVVWRKRVHRHREEACETTTSSEVHELAAPRARLTTRGIAGAVAQLRSYDIAVSALAKMLAVM